MVAQNADVLQPVIAILCGISASQYCQQTVEIAIFGCGLAGDEASG
jgi:hypothetical protein